MCVCVCARARARMCVGTTGSGGKVADKILVHLVLSKESDFQELGRKGGRERKEEEKEKEKNKKIQSLQRIYEIK